MNSDEIDVKIATLQSRLDGEIEKYNIAIDENAGFDIRKKIREEMRRIGDEIIALKKTMPSQKNS
jgi:hypothetical protein